MSKDEQVPGTFEVINPPNLLQAKVGRKLWKSDTEYLKKAEAALDELQSEFSAWLEEDIGRLIASRDAYFSDPTADKRTALLCAAHDLKGLGVTYQYPLVTQFAGALQLYLDEYNENEVPNRKIVDAHVKAIRAVLAHDIKDDKDELARAVLKELHAALAHIKQDKSTTQA